MYRVRCVLDEGYLDVRAQSSETGKTNGGSCALDLSEWLLDESYHSHERFCLRCRRDGDIYIYIYIYIHTHILSLSLSPM